MSYSPKYKKFVFESFDFNKDSLLLTLNYSFDHEVKFTETIQFFTADSTINEEVLRGVCEYVFLVAGTSYYKLFPTPNVELGGIKLNKKQAKHMTKLYRGGLSQFVYENNLDTSVLATFTPSKEKVAPASYKGEGILLMQSGGKDSLLSAELLKDAGHDFTMFHASTTGDYPKFLGGVGKEIVVAKRTIDFSQIKAQLQRGGLNGHIPFSALFAGYALIQAVLLNKSIAVASIETSAEEPNLIRENGFEVNHQYSKKYDIELGMQDYLHSAISEDLHYGSILRPFNEAKIGKLFSEYAWSKYKDEFSSCNLANYKQGEDDGQLTWCSNCPKCANSFVLFAPFVPKHELLEVFSGNNLLQSPDMKETYKDLFDLSDVKPMECVGTFSEMQYLYHAAKDKDADFNLGFEVPVPNFDINELSEHQSIFDDLINYKEL